MCTHAVKYKRINKKKIISNRLINHIILFSLSGVGGSGGEGGWGVEGKVGGRLVHQSKNGLNWLCFKNYTWAHWSIHHAAFSMGEY